IEYYPRGNQNGLKKFTLRLCIFFGTFGCEWLTASSPSLLRFGDPLRAGSRCENGQTNSPARINGPSGATSPRCSMAGPVGLPLCRPLSGGVWEVRASLPSKREARVFFGSHN